MHSNRTEQEILDDLKNLSHSKGYAHIIASLQFESNVFTYAEDEGIQEDDFLNLYSRDRTHRNELNLLIGFMIQSKIDFSNIIKEEYFELMDKTTGLLRELHDSMNLSNLQHIIQQSKDYANSEKKDVPSFSEIMRSASALKETTFYASESAYPFQYQDFAIERYENDKEWFLETKGFSLDLIKEIIPYIFKTRQKKIEAFQGKQEQDILLSLLDTCIISVDEIYQNISKYGFEQIKNFLESFSVEQESNKEFQKVADYNLAQSHPFIKLDDNRYCLFEIYNLVESIYDSPFYWMMKDDDYKEKASKNRGKFTEDFTEKRLKSVFPNGKIYKNIYLRKSKANREEIDTLLIYADKVFFIETKSKGLTLKSRSGDTEQADKDFKNYAQIAYDKTYHKAEGILEGNNFLEYEDGTRIDKLSNISEIFIICLTSAYYPSLAAQARHFLNIKQHDIIKNPYVIDIFVFDVICELLENNPIYFLDFIKRRLENTKQLISENELEIFSYYLSHNLFLQDENTLIGLQNDCSASVDKAMLVRRDGIKGERTPQGILTNLENTFFSQYIIPFINSTESGISIELGYYFLSSGQETIENISLKCRKLVEEVEKSKVSKGFSLNGLSVWVVSRKSQKEIDALLINCNAGKYHSRAEKWLGILICLDNKDYIEYVIKVESKWEYCKELNKIAQKKYRNQKKAEQLKSKSTRQYNKKKISRNELCPCNSSLKYKKCCLKNG